MYWEAIPIVAVANFNTFLHFMTTVLAAMLVMVLLSGDVSVTSQIWKYFILAVTKQQLSFEENKVAGPKATSLIDFVHTWFKDWMSLSFKQIWPLWSPYMMKNAAPKSAV